MRAINTLTTIAVLFATASTAIAEPKNGFGLNAGYVSHSRDCGGCLGSSSSGFSIGLDYQFALSDKLSLSPFLMSSGESNSNAPDSMLGHGIFGAQLRYWVGGMFLGGHLGSYSEVISDGLNLRSGAGFGSGLVAGWESPNGGLYVMGQLDSVKVKYPETALYYAWDVPISGLRLSMGYRWK